MSKVVVVQKENDHVVYQPVDIKDWKGMDGENFLSHSFLLDSFRKIMGRTLTMIDASIPEKQQNKAMKDIVRGIFSDEIGFASEMAYDQKKLQDMIGEIEEEEMPDAVSIEEVLGVK